MLPKCIPTIALCLASLLGAGSARAGAPPAWEALRARAQPLDGLSGFLDRYLGRCPPSDERRECLLKAKRERDELTGKLFYVRVDGDVARLLQPDRFDPEAGELTLQLTPFFDASGLALTEGKPLGLDAQGRPRIAQIPLVARLSPEEDAKDVERLLRTGQVRLELVFKPAGSWSLPAKGKAEALEGVRASLLGIRLANGRTGETLALRLR